MIALFKYLWGSALNNLRERGVPLPTPKQGGKILIYEPGKPPRVLGESDRKKP